LLNAPALSEQRIAEIEETRDRQALGVPNFSCEAAFLLDAMAALPRKWDPGGEGWAIMPSPLRCIL
jgi:hypothetical protein